MPPLDIIAFIAMAVFAASASRDVISTEAWVKTRHRRNDLEEAVAHSERQQHIMTAERDWNLPAPKRWRQP